MRTLLTAVLLLAPLPPAAAALKQLEKTAGRIAEAVLESTSAPSLPLAVVPFTTFDGRESAPGRLLAEAVLHRLSSDPRVTALDRSYVKRMMEEIHFGMTGAVDPSQVMEAGRMSAARFLLVGTVDPIGDELSVRVRLLETETSQVIGTAKASLDWDEDARAAFRVQDAPAVLRPQAHDLQEEGPGGCRWWQAAGEASGEGPSAQAQALAQARQALLSGFLGRPLEAPADLADPAVQESLEGVLRASRSGRIAQEKLAARQADRGRLKVELRACLLPSKEAPFRAELLLNQSRFVQGQEARALIVTGAPAYLALYSVDFEQKAGRVYPLPGGPFPKTAADKLWVFPDASHRGQGIRLVAELPAGAERSVETLRLLAFARDPGTLLDGAQDYPEIVRRLQDAGLAWSEDVRVFSIRKE